MHPTPTRLLLGLLVLSAPGLPAAAAVLDVGVGQTYVTLAAAVAAAQGGDTIDMFAGTPYTNQTAVINVPLTIQGVDGTPVFAATNDLSNGKGYLVIKASATIDNIEFDNAVVGAGNGAGIRYQAGNLVVSASRFVDNQDGILATPNTLGTGSVLVKNSTFLDNGVASGPYAGFAHAIYATQVASLDGRLLRRNRHGHADPAPLRRAGSAADAGGNAGDVLRVHQRSALPEDGRDVRSCHRRPGRSVERRWTLATVN
jgi:hypothetical protein